MPEEVDVACPSCNAIFSVPLEFCGETAQCAECETIFEIPNAEEGSADGQLLTTDTGAIKTSDDAGEATNTVRLSRTGIGMIPQVKDSFAFNAAPSAPAPSPMAKPSLAKPQKPSKPSAPPPAPAPAAPPAGVSAGEQTAPPKAPPAPASAPKKEKILVPSWTKIRMKKDEDVLGLKEYSGSPAGMAIAAAVIAALSGGAGIALGKNLPIAAVLVVLLAAAAGAAVFFMAKGTSKAALVLTSLRSICVIGSKRLEITK